MKYKLIALIVLLILPLSVAGYAEEKPKSDTVKEETPIKTPDSHIGTVVESIDVGNYIYILLTMGDRQQWISTFSKNLPSDLKPGEKIEYAGGMMMQGFESKSLKRTFDSMLLISKVRSLREKIKRDPDKPMPADDAHKQVYKKPSGAEAYDTPPKKGEIPKAVSKKGQAHAMTVEEILAYNGTDPLPEEQVVVRARVMKIKGKILGKTWVTIQDGTGKAPDNKLIATTTYPIELGKTYRVYGFIKNDVDLGSGYLYKVLFEEAQFVED